MKRFTWYFTCPICDTKIKKERGEDAYICPYCGWKDRN